MSSRFPIALELAFLAALTAVPAARASGDPQIDPELLAGMKARAVGPATMSGRTAAIEVVASDRRIVYVGAATGGLWKSVNGATTWEPIFDRQPVAAIGAVAVFQASPDVVWVGTGEGNPRNSASVGNGVYKSLDGGKTWTHLGLEKTERVHRILLDPTNRDVAYVAALGTTWGENPERGVYKTTDGGATWEQVLYVDERTGAADLVMDPTNPHKLLAALWDHRRWPWSMRSGGPGSGLYLTYDGGRNWKRLSHEEGLPEGALGRMGLAIAPSDARIVYALIETDEEIALYRSEDGGESFRRTAARERVGNRPFYYADLRVDPQDPDRIYSLWGRLSVSDDGGKSFEILGGRTIHPDHHAMWIDPTDPNFILDGNDGGVYVSQDRGETWRFVSNLPLGQYYHIRVDDQVPYQIYGGMQDNGSWVGPSSVWEVGEIRNHHWLEVGFGDGFDTAPLRGDTQRGFSMSQEGYLMRWDRRTGERKDVRPAGPEGEELRFNWNAGFALDPFDEETLYLGSQFLHRSRDLGETWEVISPDLTSDNPEWQRQHESGGLTLDVTGAENFTTIVAVAPSPVQRDLLWVGTDDGRLHVTRNGGGDWVDVTRKVQGVPANTWIPHIAPSPHDAATAFVVFDDHRRSNWTPYVYKTADYGKSFESLATDEIWGYCLTMAQDPVDPNLLFLGTEFGLHVSVDAGRSWMRWTHGVPTVSVMDLVIHPREHDLVLGTHGRSAFVLDDIRPLRELTPQVLAKSLHLFEPPPAQQHRVAQASSSRFPAHGEFRGENRPYGALLTFSLNDPDLPPPDEEGAGPSRRRDSGQSSGQDAAGKTPQAEVEIHDGAGELVRSLEVDVHRGVNRTAWDLRFDAFDAPPREGLPSFFEPQGPEVLPGTYQVTVRYGEAEAQGQVKVLADPRYQIPQAERRAKLEAQMQAGALQERLTKAIKKVLATRRDVETVLIKLRGEEAGEDGERRTKLLEDGQGLLQGLEDLEGELRVPPDTQDLLPDQDAWAKVAYVQRSLGSSWDEPTAAQRQYLKAAERAVDEALEVYDRFFEDRVAPFTTAVTEAGIGLLGGEE